MGENGAGARAYFAKNDLIACTVAWRCTAAIDSSSGMSLGQTSAQFPALPQSVTPPSSIITSRRSDLMALPIGLSLKRLTWLITAAPTKWFAGVYCGHASRQHPQAMQRLSG